MTPISQPPLVSIVTIVRNGEDSIETTIKSIVNQSYPNIEYIIIDGKSTDRTVEIIEKYADKIAYWISEPDRGISDAWNKGISACHGDLISILNAGDIIPPDYVDSIIRDVSIDKPILAYGDVQKIDDAGKVIKTVKGHFNPHNISDRIGFLHPGCFGTRKAYDLVGLFDLKYRLAMDCDWIFRAYRSGVSFQKVDATCMMLEGGLSSNSNIAAFGEYLQAMRNNDFSSRDVYLSMLTASVRGLVKSMIRQG
jgi:glycosyltransferase involved in cell wall biosynthesis